MSALVFTLGCRKGHRINVDELEAKRINGTACQECYGMLLVVGVRGSVGEGARVTAQRCPHHVNGDSICRRQKGA